MDSAALTREQSRQVDRRAVAEYGMTGLVLMENAGRGLADAVFKLGLAQPVVICCGRGNNAGDGFVLARHLDLRRVRTKVLLWSAPADLSDDAVVNFAILEKSGVPITIFPGAHDADRLQAELQGAGTIVDCLLGTGARGAPRPPLDAVIEQLNAQQADKLAVDLPSGLDCDTGVAAHPTFRAAHTCTFVARKQGFNEPGAEAYTGQVHVLDIGAPRKLIDEIVGAAGPNDS